MKTSKDNQTLMVLLLCVGFLLAATLACRIPGLGSGDDDPPVVEVFQETVSEETLMVVDDPVDDPIEDDETVDDDVVLTDRKIYEPMLVYPGTRVIYDSDDQFFGVSATIVLAVDAPLRDVIAFYLDGYDEGYLALEPDEAEGIRELVLFKDMFDWRDDEVEAFYRRLIGVEQVEYSLTLLAVMPADEFDKEDFNIMPGQTVEAYAPNEALIIFMLSHLENTLEMMDGL